MVRGTAVGAALVLMAGVGTASIPARASGQERMSLSLEEAIRIAKDGNPAFLAATNDLDRAKWEVRESWGQFLPSVAAGGGAQYEYAGRTALRDLLVGRHCGGHHRLPALQLFPVRQLVD